MTSAHLYKLLMEHTGLENKLSVTMSSTATRTSRTSSANDAVITDFPPVPLNNSFVPPNDCSGLYLSNGLFVIDASTSCLPPLFNEKATAYYSPGLDCPSGYATGCYDTEGVKSITTVTCCPVRGEVTMTCQTNPTNLEGIFSTMFCTWAPPDKATRFFKITASSGGTTSISTATFVSPGGFNALGVRMVHESSDFATTTEGKTKNPTKTKGTGPGNTITMSPTPSPSSSGLSTGAKAAIGVVIPLVFLAILAAVFFWFRRRRNTNKTQDYDTVVPPNPMDDKKQPLYGGASLQQHPVYEMDTPAAELPDNESGLRPHAELADVSPISRVSPMSQGGR
jgi:hypothetical protein